MKIKNLETKTAQRLIKDYIDSNAVLQTDKSITFSDLSDCIDVHVREISGTQEGNFNLKWVHIAISNLKKHLQTYHMISERMMQNYLDESFVTSSTEDTSVKNSLTDSSLFQFTHTSMIEDNHIILLGERN